MSVQFQKRTTIYPRKIQEVLLNNQDEEIDKIIMNILSVIELGAMLQANDKNNGSK